MLCCDFCSASIPTTKYRTHPFGLTDSSQVFGDTPIYTIQGLDHVSTEDLHPSHGTGAMMSPEWLACDDCTIFIDARDREGLVQYCVMRLSAQPNLESIDIANELIPMYRKLFTAFFLYLESKEPSAASRSDLT